MLKKFFSAVGFLTSIKRRRDTDKEGFSPYLNPEANTIYNLLFCDKLELFRRDAKSATANAWQALLGSSLEADVLQAIAVDQTRESRQRMLAYNRLREADVVVPAKQLFGVIIELGLPKGPDTLATYSDGRVDYINHIGVVSTYQPAPLAWMPAVYKVLNAGQQAVDTIGPWQQMRLAPPANGYVRMSFLVSDGLYFGEGPINVMEQDDRAKPIIAAGLALLKIIVAQSEQAAAAVQKKN